MPKRYTSVRALITSSGRPASVAAVRAAAMRPACSSGVNSGPPAALESSRSTPTAPAATTAATVLATSAGAAP
ncbi:hypothetical protein SHIRM173S_13305 [Streptomyces hirsutus]